jgi:hypothetical protein
MRIQLFRSRAFKGPSNRDAIHTHFVRSITFARRQAGSRLTYSESIIQRVMKSPDFATGITRLQENLNILADTQGNVAPENRAAWNISNALIVVLDLSSASSNNSPRLTLKIRKKKEASRIVAREDSKNGRTGTHE